MRVIQHIGAHGEWTCEMEWTEDTSAGPVRLTIRPTDADNPPPGGVSTTVLREVNPRQSLAEHRPQDAAGRWRYEQRLGTQLRQWNEAGEGLSDRYLATLAALYLSAVAHDEEHLLDYLARYAGRSRSTVKGNLQQARRRGLLDGHANRRGGKLTAKAQKLLHDGP